MAIKTKQELRIVQLIDSLHAGGGERMAVNYANALTGVIGFSGLVCTREEGVLTKTVDLSVSYLFLKRQKKIDVHALIKFKNYIKKHKVNLIHAHGSSYFFASLVKIIIPSVQIIWHDHNGNRLNLKNKNRLIKLFSVFFLGVISVNMDLEAWTKQYLKISKSVFLPNFSIEITSTLPITDLKGIDSKRIVCLANLREPKNHITLIKSFYESGVYQQEWTLHLIGKDYNDSYSRELKSYIKQNNLQKHVFIYGSCSDIKHILSQAQIGVLVSTYEGFPVTLLEYGMSNLAVISTDVGYCSEIIKNDCTGLLVNPMNQHQIEVALLNLVNNKYKIEKFSLKLNTLIDMEYRSTKVIQSYLDFVLC